MVSVQDNGAELDASTVYESNNKSNLALGHAHVVIAIDSLLCVFAGRPRAWNFSCQHMPKSCIEFYSEGANLSNIYMPECRIMREWICGFRSV